MVLVVARTLPQAIEMGLRFAGPLFFMGLQASSVKTATKIWNEKSVGTFSVFPFVSLLTNCIIWTFYGLLRVDNTVLYPNAIGALAGASCIGMYQSVANVVPMKLYTFAAAIIAFSTYTFMKGNYKLLGSVGCALAVILSGSPLVTLATVIKDKSTASLPFATSFTTWCNALSWASYGLLVAHDPMVAKLSLTE
mmetsp:Transcript_13555/g.20335  ORF Transcript_13555/g.20335 Transcript_13555/m.20335 type:complete len:194 (-) Transcript_13555:322-903(-)